MGEEKEAKDPESCKKFKEKKKKSVKNRLRKFWKKKVFGASDEEILVLLDHDSNMILTSPTSSSRPTPQSNSAISDVEVTNQQEEDGSKGRVDDKRKKSRGKRILKRLRKWTLTTCRYIGSGAMTLSAPGLAPYSYMSHSMISRYHRPYAFEGPHDDYLYQTYYYDYLHY